MKYCLPKKVPSVLRVPKWVASATMADQIRFHYTNRREPIPKVLKEFIAPFPKDTGYDWEVRMLHLLCATKDADLINKWLLVLPGGFARAELRGFLKTLQ